MKGVDNQKIYREKFTFLQTQPTMLSRIRTWIRHQLRYVLLFSSKISMARSWWSDEDCTGITQGRFVRLTDPLENLKNPYHLVQQLPRRIVESEANQYRHLVRHVLVIQGIPAQK